MLEKLPIKKEYLLVIGSIVSLLLSYNLAIRKTLEAWQTNIQLQAQLNVAEDLKLQPDYLNRKNKNLDKIIALYKTDTSIFRNITLSKVSLLAEKENVTLSEVPTEDMFLHTSQFVIQRLSFEGDFFALTRLLNDLQSLNNVGLTRSVSYKSVKNYNASISKLVMDVYFEVVSQ